MKILKRWYVRFLISLLMSGVISEVISISIGEEFQMHPIVSFILIFGMYFSLSISYGFHLRKKDKASQKNL